MNYPDFPIGGIRRPALKEDQPCSSQVQVMKMIGNQVIKIIGLKENVTNLSNRFNGSYNAFCRHFHPTCDSSPISVLAFNKEKRYMSVSPFHAPMKFQ
uniref:Uncharacterized protein n=1 Tax=Picea glauca TaxID=3330 RepID=A0A101M1K2_PICGL|nr:hypothetical protein ABT39_MTgene3864 [Picea glauca]QHR86137.1 hypothetical protein Q903MT_gene136 [Picea sitchensis]